MFNGLDMKKIFEKAKEMQEHIAEKKKKASEETVDVSVGGGMVQIIMNGDLETLLVKIDPEVVNKNEIEILEDLVRAAVNEATRKARELVSDHFGDMMSDFDITDLGRLVK